LSYLELLGRRPVLWILELQLRLLLQTMVYVDRPTQTTGHEWCLWGSEGSPGPGQFWRTVLPCNLYRVGYQTFFLTLDATNTIFASQNIIIKYVQSTKHQSGESFGRILPAWSFDELQFNSNLSTKLRTVSKSATGSTSISPILIAETTETKTWLNYSRRWISYICAYI